MTHDSRLTIQMSEGVERWKRSAEKTAGGEGNRLLLTLPSTPTISAYDREISTEHSTYLFPHTWSVGMA